jgi:hypothetical protein
MLVLSWFMVLVFWFRAFIAAVLAAIKAKFLFFLHIGNDPAGAEACQGRHHRAWSFPTRTCKLT